jgi:hypothetical protein
LGNKGGELGNNFFPNSPISRGVGKKNHFALVLDFLISIDPMKDILLRPHCEAKTVEVFLKILKGTNAGQF